MFGSMGQSAVKNLGNGGTMDGDVTITGDLDVSGGIGLGLSEVIEGTSTIDVTSTEAFLVRKNGDGGDVFVVDTTNSDVTVGGDFTVTGADFTIVGATSSIIGEQSAGATRGKIKFITSSGDGSIAFETTTNGAGAIAEAMRINHDGSVGIGTASPNESGFSGDCSVLSIQGSAADGFGALELITPDVTSSNRLGEIRFVNLDASGSTPAAYAGIRSVRDGADDAANLSFWTEPTGGSITQQLVITSAGHLNLTQNINLLDNKAVTLGSDDDAQIWNDGSNTYIRNNTSNQDIIIQVNDDGSAATEVMRIDASTSRVGIGVAVPDGTLHVHTGTAGSITADITDLVVETSGSGGISILTPNDEQGELVFGDQDDANICRIAYNHGGNYLATVVNATEVMRIDSAGNVGIGTTGRMMSGYDANSTTLTVYDGSGGAQSGYLELGADNYVNGYNAGAIVFINNNNADATNHDANGKTVAQIRTEIATTDNNAGDDSGGSMTFWTKVEAGSLTERMRITSAGLVGIGTAAPDTYNDYAHNLVVYEAGHAGITIATNGANHCSIYFADGTSGAEGYAGYLDYNHNTNVFDFGVAGLPKMKLDANSRISLSNNDGNTSNTVFGYHALTNAGTVLSDVGADNNTAIGHLAMGTGTTLAATDNTAIGYKSLEDITTGDFNTGIGVQSLTNITDAVRNTAVGYSSLSTNVSGNYNTAIGMHTLLNNLTHNNTAVGYESGLYTTGADNTYVGFSAGKGAAGAELSNTGVGANSLLKITDGGYNVALGSRSGEDLTTGDFNVFVGDYAGHSTTNALRTVAIGHSAMGTANVHADAIGAVAIGYESLAALTSGAANTAVGYNAGLSITTGGENTILGHLAGDNIGVGNSNTLVGQAAGGALADGDNNVCIGASAMASDTDGQGSTAVGTSALGSQNITSEGLTRNTGLGYQSGLYNQTGTSNTYVGYRSGFGNSGDSNSNNTAVGDSALTAITTGSYNAILGASAGTALTDGHNNIAIGSLALSTSTSAGLCIAIGDDAMRSGTAAADGTIAIGASALADISDGASNTAVGFEAGTNVTTGGLNTFVGYLSGHGLDGSAPLTGSWNTCVGEESGYLLQGASNANTLVGQGAGDVITTGTQNTCIGRVSDPSSATATNQTVIGYNATGQGNNSVTLGNANVTAVYMSSDSGATVHADKYMSTTMPAFLAHPASNQDDIAVGSWVPIVLGTERFDQGSNFASNTFTAPVTGKYQLNVVVRMNAADSASAYYQVRLVTSNYTYYSIIDPDFGQDAAYWNICLPVLADMDVSDTAAISIYQSGGTQQTDIHTETTFSGYLVC